MNKIYIVLMRTNTFVEKGVRFFTRYQYGHVAISLNKDCKSLYSYGRRKVHSILFGGFTEEKQDGPFFTYFNKAECKIYELEVSDEQYKKMVDIINEMKNNMKKYRYDYLGIVLRYFRIPISFKNKFVCSSFVGYALDNAKIHKFNKKISFVRPKDIEEINELKEIYSGLYRDYNNANN